VSDPAGLTPWCAVIGLKRVIPECATVPARVAKVRSTVQSRIDPVIRHYDFCVDASVFLE
jgi:hypothetical protein